MKFTDKKMREITIADGAGDEITASSSGKIIGRMEVTSLDHDDRQPADQYQLIGMFVDAEYQRSGIASAMLRYAVQQYERLIPPPHDHGDPNAMTIEGMAFVQWAIKHQLVCPIFIERPDEDY